MSSLNNTGILQTSPYSLVSLDNQFHSNIFQALSQQCQTRSPEEKKSLNQLQQLSVVQAVDILAGSPINRRHVAGLSRRSPPHLVTQPFCSNSQSMYTHSQPPSGQLSPGIGLGCIIMQLMISLSLPTIFNNISRQRLEAVNPAANETQNRSEQSNAAPLNTVSQN